jgi:hypothetical protein
MDKKPVTDPIEKNLPWLTPWFINPANSALNLTENEATILSEISNRWLSTEKIVLFDSLGVRFGRDVVGRVIDNVIAAHIQPEWEEISRGQPSQTIADLVRLLWGPLPEAGFDVAVENQPDGVQILCTRCPHADLAKQINASEWLYHLVCSGDPHAAAGFNSQIGFRRTQTLMEGHPCCDHFYFMIE